MQLNPGWTLQPDFQYILQPGGNVTGQNGRMVEKRLLGHVRPRVFESRSDVGRVHETVPVPLSRCIELSRSIVEADAVA